MALASSRSRTEKVPARTGEESAPAGGEDAQGVAWSADTARPSVSERPVTAISKLCLEPQRGG